MNSIQRDLLLYFRTDAASSRMYKTLIAQGYDKRELAAMFLALRTIGFLARTNTRGPMAATFCVTKLGRSFLLHEYGISLEGSEQQKEFV